MVADEANIRPALDLAVGDATTRNLADLRDVEHLEDLGIAKELFARDRREKTRTWLSSHRPRGRR